MIPGNPLFFAHLSPVTATMNPALDNTSPDSWLAAATPAVRERAQAIEAILQALELGSSLTAAGRLYPFADAGVISLEQIARQAGQETADLVAGILALPVLDTVALEPASGAPAAAQTERLRKMLLAMVRDVRVILIRLADQLASLRALKKAPAAAQQAAAHVIHELYAPLASRLGIWQIKWELEDLAFRYLEPATYRRIAGLLAERRTERAHYIEEVLAQIRTALAAEDIHAEVKGRPKHIYSIWRKMQRKELAFESLSDLRAVRILVNTVTECYTVLGIVHGLWTHIPREFDDYIAKPKENQYRSLHTAVIGPQGKTLEIQIRTHDMNRHAELGIAAHWRYKEGGGSDPGLEQKIAWLRRLLEPADEIAGEQDLLARFKDAVYEERVYVITPKGAIMDLPAGSTPLDFAYHIHTELGHRCRGAKVNGRMAPLTQILHSGDQVEVITARQGEPSRDWLIPQLGYLASPRARAKVKAWFRQLDHEQHLGQGRGIVERELHRLGAADMKYEELATEFSTAPTLDAFLALVGAGDITPAQLAGAVQRRQGQTNPLPLPRERPPVRHKKSSGIRVQGVGNLLTHLARCCHPLPPDPIVGFITRGRGVTVHHQACRSLLRAAHEDRSRLIDVDWGRDQQATYPVDVQIDAHDRHGLLRDIAAALSTAKVNILAMNSAVNRNQGLAQVQLTLEIENLTQLSQVLNRLHQLPGIIEAVRRQTH